MSLNNSLAALSATVKDMPAAQNAAVAVADLAGKGGFTAEATLGQMLEFQLTGLLVVFTVLGGLTLLCIAMAWLIKTLAPDQYYCRPKTAVLPPADPAPELATANIHPGLADEELVAILSAAAIETLGHSAAIVKFRSMESMDWTWSVQGRVILHSHKT